MMMIFAEKNEQKLKTLINHRKENIFDIFGMKKKKKTSL